LSGIWRLRLRAARNAPTPRAWLPPRPPSPRQCFLGASDSLVPNEAGTKARYRRSCASSVEDLRRLILLTLENELPAQDLRSPEQCIAR
jgi:hypothetical protein